ncbi:Peptidoglycan glycosyltransferase [Oscillochloris trichoides DG-6]|uniref:Peptidoglycan glycosyltransferase n=1 Tax=Oscillochloris trichoides DG-6 TaxID=765420 RepID=E1IHH4_9CHLR|nr:penicillin-binding protein 2 [Oscillochloris trichoides]EFO79337.1 Peptidoglycan glycosyltransferase [Oscillochloris trichoides DG-6]
MAPRTTNTLRTQPGVANAPVRVRLPRWRINVILLFCMLLMGRVVLRLGELQIVQHESLSALARAEIDRQVPIQAQRGLITDHLGNVLAMDVDRESLWVVPAQIDPEHAPKLALSLAAILNQDAEKILATLTNRDYYWLPVARWLEPEVAAQIDALDEPGLHWQYEPRRVYPQGTFAAQILGAANFNGDGISGVEGFYNQVLQGVDGSVQAEFDPNQNPIAIAPSRTLPPSDGADLTLTIDPLVQYVIERELQQAVQQHNADGGTIIVLDPKTGAIRGMASWPTFDPNRYGDYPPEVYGRNPAISNLYEPGSTFKMITVAAGLQSRSFDANVLVNDTGTIYRYGYWLKNWNAGGNGMIDPGKVIYYSSNVGALLLNEITGPENFYRIVHDFGFGQPTGVDMAGEEVGIVNAWGTPAYNDLGLLTNAYGQSISVTPLQMVQAAAAIANDGVRMRPYIVEKRCQAGRCTETEPTQVGQPIDKEVAWTIRRMLVNSANHYAPVIWGTRTGSYADQWLVPGYQVAAKTGTSSIPLPTGGYDQSYTIGSVLGFAPAEEARYAILVKIDRPKDDIWGVTTAIPVYYNIVDQLLRYDKVPPDPTLVSPGQSIPGMVTAEP